MRLLKLGFIGSAAAAILAGIGCGHKGPSAAETTQVLEQNFKTAEPATRQAVAEATTAINAAATGDLDTQRSHYIEAVRPMAHVVARGNLSREQVQAVHQVYLQVHQAAKQNPALVNKEFYEAQAALANQLYKAGVRP